MKMSKVSYISGAIAILSMIGVAGFAEGNFRMSLICLLVFAGSAFVAYKSEEADAKRKR